MNLRNTIAILPAALLAVGGYVLSPNAGPRVQSGLPERPDLTVERSYPDVLDIEPDRVEPDVAPVRGGRGDLDLSRHAFHGGGGGGFTTDPELSRKAAAKWLVQHQNKDGGWGAGSWGGPVTEQTSDVATTAVAVLALQREAAGSDKNRDSIIQGIRYVTGVVDKSPAQGPGLDVPQGTQPQRKLGQYVDTHMAALMLGEVMGKYGSSVDRDADRALTKVIAKVQAAQGGDGSFDSNGWAPVLSHSVAAQSLMKAKDLGKEVDDVVLKRAQDFEDGLVDERSGAVDASKGAGVTLYGAASGLRGRSESASRGDVAAEADAQAVKKAIIDNPAMISGFGSMGGEEMLSYLMISDTLAKEGGDDWETWESRINKHLTATQNQDGSWSGHHCITSTTFVTAAGLMTMSAEQALTIRPAGTRKGVEPGAERTSPAGDTGFAPIPPAGALGG